MTVRSSASRRRQPGRDVPAPGRRRGAVGEQAQGGRNELHRLEVLHGGGSAGGQSGYGYTPSWQEQWVVWTVCVFVCLRVPGLTVLLMPLLSLNSCDTLNWSVNCCEISHEWSHDSSWRTCNFYFPVWRARTVDLSRGFFCFFLWVSYFFPLFIPPGCFVLVSVSSAFLSVSVRCFSCGGLKVYGVLSVLFSQCWCNRLTYSSYVSVTLQK